MYQELIGTAVSIAPEQLRWNQEERCIRGKYEGIEFIVPTEELSLQDMRWNRYNFPGDIKIILKNGLTGIVKAYENGKLIISRKAWQFKQYNELNEEEVYIGTIYSVTPDSVYVMVNDLQVRVHAVECSRSRMNNMLNYFEKDRNIKLKIIGKAENFPYWISGSRKQAYPSITDSEHEFKSGDEIFVMVTERLNKQGTRVEVTPNIPGILDGPEWKLNTFYPGLRVKARVKRTLPNGIKLSIE